MMATFDRFMTALGRLCDDLRGAPRSLPDPAADRPRERRRDGGTVRVIDFTTREVARLERGPISASAAMEASVE